MNTNKPRPVSGLFADGSPGSRDRTQWIAIPQGWSTWSHELREGETIVGSIVIPWYGEEGTFTSAGRSWTLGREARTHGAFFLKQAGRTFATAEKPSAFFRAFQLDFDNEYFAWEAESSWGQGFLLRKGNQVIGSMRPLHGFSRRSKIDLPSELSVERKAFLVWLVLILWRRQS